MRKPVRLTNRFLTVEEIGKLSGMSPSRVAEVVRLTEKTIAESEKGRGRRIVTKARRTSPATKKKRAAKTSRLQEA
jgi:hypothetical protein